MPGQMDPTPASAFINSYLAAHANEFRSYATALNLPPTAAIAGASGVAEEMSP
jgi:hypothetical protein